MKLKNFLYLIFAFLTFVLMGCRPKAGIDPHLSADEIFEIKEDFNSFFVGKWNVENSSKISLKFSGTCYIISLEFTEEGKYILKVGDSNDNLVNPRFFTGVYVIKFDESDPTKIEVDKLFLMGDGVEEDSSPQIGSIATFDSINISDTGDLSFNVTFGQDTSDYCSVGQTINVDANKEEPLVSDAPEDSNHFKIQKEWRLIRIDAQSGTESITTTITNPFCELFEEEYEDRCTETPDTPVTDGCNPSDTVVLTFTGYGTYLWVFYDSQGNSVHFEEGSWKWVEKVPQDYSQFEVGFDQSGNSQGENYNQIISILELTENSFVAEEVEQETVNGVTYELVFKYGFQPSSFNYTPLNCDL